MRSLLRRTFIVLILLVLLVIAVACYVIRLWVPIVALPSLDTSSITFKTYNPLFTPVAEQLESLMPKWRQEHLAPSISLAIGYRGELVWAGAVGHVNIEQQQSATLTTSYRIGSVSKTFLSTAIAIAVEREIVQLDQPIENYRPSYPHTGQGVTLRRLLSHQAGIRHYGMIWRPPFFEFYLNRDFDSVDQGLALFVDDPLQYTPGEQFMYSSYGFNLASGVLESAKREDFLSYVSQNIFSPLTMDNSAAEGQQHDLQTAQWYDILKDHDGVRTTNATNASYKWAGGGFLSTPSDLVKLGNAWLDNTLFSQQIKHTFWTPQTLNNGQVNAQSYALGWRAERKVLENIGDEQPDYFVHHGGTAAGSSAFLLIFPEHELVIAAAINGLQSNNTATPDISFETAYHVIEWQEKRKDKSP